MEFYGLSCLLSIPAHVYIPYHLLKLYIPGIVQVALARHILDIQYYMQVYTIRVPYRYCVTSTSTYNYVYGTAYHGTGGCGAVLWPIYAAYMYAVSHCVRDSASRWLVTTGRRAPGRAAGRSAQRAGRKGKALGVETSPRW